METAILIRRHGAKLLPLLSQGTRLLRGLVMVLLVIPALPPRAYGSYDVLLGLIALTAAFSVGLLAQGTIRFVAHYRGDPQAQQALLEFVAVLTLALGLAGGGLAWALSPWLSERLRLPELLGWAWLIPAVVLLQGLRGLALHTLQGQERYGRLLGVESALNGLFIGLVIGLWAQRALRLEALLLSFFAAETLSAVAAWALAWPWLPRRLRWHRAYFSSFWAFSRHLALYMLTLQAGQYADVLLISAYLSPEQAGLYAAVKRLTDAVALTLLNAINTVVLPRSAVLHAQRDWRGLRRLRRRAIAYGLILLGPLGLLCLLAAEPIVETLYRGAYAASASVLRLLGLGFGAEVLYLTGLNVLMGIGRTEWVWRVQLLRLAASMALYLILIPQYGVLGAALSNLLAAAAAGAYAQVGLRGLTQPISSGCATR
ncbi:MAG: lipopolysaccharide biosynthesis protein [Bacteroidetes bacterium]|nr:lipopolysaccharide biosynthesis protein [Bacteroidota bacterium]